MKVSCFRLRPYTTGEAVVRFCPVTTCQHCSGSLTKFPSLGGRSQLGSCSLFSPCGRSLRASLAHLLCVRDHHLAAARQCKAFSQL